MIRFLRIVLLSIGAAVVYGIAQDQITARVCVEYFTIGHPLIIPTESPTALAFLWGVLATWWVGLMLGVPLGLVACVGSRPKMEAGDLLKPIGVLLVCIGVSAFVFGVIGFLAAKAGGVWLPEPLASDVPREKHGRFLADLWAHSAAYGVGFLGGLVLCVWTWRHRKKMRTE